MASAKSECCGDMEEILTCSICLELVQDPNTLMQCFHNFCKKCVDQLMEKQNNEELGVVCPICRTFSAAKEIRNNYFVNNLLSLHSKLQNKDQSSVQPCGQCQPGNAGPAEWKCVDCRLHLCDTCKLAHLRIPLLQGHTVLPVSNDTELVVDQLVFCGTHTGKPLEFYCNQCNMAICNTCHVVSHKAHNMVTGEEALEEKKQQVGTKMDLLDQKYSDMEKDVKGIEEKQQKTVESYARCREDVDREAERLIAEIKAEQNKLKLELTIEENGQIDILNNSREKFIDQQKEITNIKMITKTSCEHARSMSLLTQLTNGGLYERLEKLTVEKHQMESLILKWPELKVDKNQFSSFAKRGTLGQIVKRQETYGKQKVSIVYPPPEEWEPAMHSGQEYLKEAHHQESYAYAKSEPGMHSGQKHLNTAHDQVKEVQWQYTRTVPGHIPLFVPFQSYPPEINAVIEKAFAHNKSNVKFRKADGMQYKVTFCSMQETNINNNVYKVTVRRKSGVP